MFTWWTDPPYNVTKEDCLSVRPVRLFRRFKIDHIYKHTSAKQDGFQANVEVDREVDGEVICVSKPLLREPGPDLADGADLRDAVQSEHLEGDVPLAAATENVPGRSLDQEHRLSRRVHHVQGRLAEAAVLLDRAQQLSSRGLDGDPLAVDGSRLVEVDDYPLSDVGDIHLERSTHLEAVPGTAAGLLLCEEENLSPTVLYVVFVLGFEVGEQFQHLHLLLDE